MQDAADPSKIVIPAGQAGWYLVTGQVTLDYDSDGYIFLSLYKNSVEWARSSKRGIALSWPGDGLTPHDSTPLGAKLVYCNAGDYLQLVLRVRYESDGLYDFESSQSGAFFQVVKVG
jgi:hypothetical protein